MKKIKVFAVVIFCFSGIFISAQEQGELFGEQTFGVRSLNMDINSSKFTEYRELEDGPFISSMKLNFLKGKNSWFLSIVGKDLIQDDQSVRIQLGDYGNRWNLIVYNNKTPHRFSNRSQTPYFVQANGFLTVPVTVPIIRDADTTNGTPSLEPTRGQMSINDSLISEYVKEFSHLYSLDVQRDLIAATLDIPKLGPVNLSVTYFDERRTGSRSTYGALGDRPPRSLNIQMPEPVQYTTREVHANASFKTSILQADLNYTFSTFENQIDHLTWENIYFRAVVPGSDFISALPGTARNVSLFGRRALSPDNLYNNVALSIGVNLPFNSRFIASAAYGLMTQDQTLLPYSFSTLGGDTSALGDGRAWNDPNKLPFRTANAEINTLRLDADYTLTLFSKLNLRPFLRYYDLNNETPMSQWRYVTQDAAGTNGSVSYVNLRRNLAYSFDKLNYGIDLRYFIGFWRSTINLGYRMEAINRDFRETDTDENIFEGRLRLKPFDLLSVSASYLYGDRKGDTYNYKVTSNSYWYTFAMGAAQVDNPQFLFANHPDLRKFDVADRKRSELNVTAGLMLMENLELSASFNNRDYDFESDVKPVAPLLGTGIPFPNPADEFALTPGQQLGLLKESGQNISLSAMYFASERLSINIFGDMEIIDSDVRGFVFNENQRREPSNATIQAPTALGPWTDPNRIFNTETSQKTNTIGLGLSYEILPGKFRLFADYSLSVAEVDLKYSGYGSDASYLGRAWETFDFGFDDPQISQFDLYVLNTSVEYNILANLTLGVHYLFSRYLINDWVEGAEGPWVEEVGSEYFLRDTSRDNRWGNRLVNMGVYLAPSYKAHLGYVTLTYRF